MVGAVLAAEPMERTVTVSGMSQIQVVPDEVVLSLSVKTEDEKDLLKAKADNDQRTNKILKLVKESGVEDKQIKIDCLEIHQQYDRDHELLKHCVNRGIDVTLNDFSLVEKVLSDALQAGATGVSGVLFTTTKHREYQFETRRLAVEFAREKASHLAELNGVALGKPVRIEEGVEGDNHTFGGGMAMGSAMVQENSHETRTQLVSLKEDVTQKKSPADAPPNNTGTVAPGQLTISATVTITFELKNL
jgi:uncharacterized protein YggE